MSSEAIDKMKEIVKKMPEGQEKELAKYGVKNLELFEAMAGGFEKMLGINVKNKL